jgi:hypothetical protein
MPPLTGAVTSPAVMLSPNARNRVRESVGTLPPSVGPDGESPQPAAMTAQAASTNPNLSI